MSKSPKQNGKNLEFEVAELLKFFGAEVTRMRKNEKVEASRPDIILPGLPTIMIECKYRHLIKLHTLFREAKKKYCKKKDDDLLLFSKSKNQHGCLVTMEAEFFLDMFKYWSE